MGVLALIQYCLLLLLRLSQETLLPMVVAAVVKVVLEVLV